MISTKKSGRFSKTVFGVLLTIGLALGMVAGPAYASALQEGHKGCVTSTPTSWLQAKTMGVDRGGKAPGKSSFKWTFNLSNTSWSTEGYLGVNGGGNWEVYSSKYIDGPGTYAYCTGHA